MSGAISRHGRRAAVITALAAGCALAPMSAAQAALAGGHDWNYVDTFATERVCETAGELLQVFGEARDYRCVDTDDGHVLLTRSNRS